MRVFWDEDIIRIMKNLLIIFAVLAFSVPAFGQVAPDGWRFPQAKDFTGKWKSNKKDVPSPFKR